MRSVNRATGKLLGRSSELPASPWCRTCRSSYCTADPTSARMKRDRRLTRALVNRDEHALGTTPKLCRWVHQRSPPPRPPRPPPPPRPPRSPPRSPPPPKPPPPATTAAATRATLLRDVDAERATFEILTIEIAERLLGAFLRRHLDEAEAARADPSSGPASRRPRDLATRGKALRNQIFSGVKRKVTNVQTIRHFGHFSLAASKHTNPSHSRNEGEVHDRPLRERGRV